MINSHWLYQFSYLGTCAGVHWKDRAHHYDYYQPEAYVPSSDTYIEKDAAINEHIELPRIHDDASSGSWSRISKLHSSSHVT